MEIWLKFHRESEHLAGEAERCRAEGDEGKAKWFYRWAAHAEVMALGGVDQGKMRTLGILVVSVVSLWYKAGALPEARRVADTWIGGTGLLPEFAVMQLGELVKALDVEIAESDFR
jgi:hypothetical protein